MHDRKNIPEGEKQKLDEYRKKYYEVWKNKTTSQRKSDKSFWLTTVRKIFSG